MKYLNSTFSVPPPEKLDGIACLACVYGTKHGEKHADTCPKRNGCSADGIIDWQAWYKLLWKIKMKGGHGRPKGF